MNYDRILKFANLFYSMATDEAATTNSKDLTLILKNIEKLDTYVARKEYAEKNLKHLSSGSSRLVYLTPQKTVIKMCKNDKGIAQNKAEANPKMKSKYLNKIIKHANNFVWIETFYLDKISKLDFEKMTGLDFDDFGDSIRYGLKNVSENSDMQKPKNFEKVKVSDIYKEMKEIGEQFHLMPGDLARISSYGKKDGHPVLIDAGLTSKVFKDFYEESSS